MNTIRLLVAYFAALGASTALALVLAFAARWRRTGAPETSPGVSGGEGLA